MSQNPGPVLTTSLLTSLKVLGEGLVKGPDAEALEKVLIGLSALPVSAIANASSAISREMHTGWQPRPPLLSLERLKRTNHTETSLLMANPAYAWLFLFHFSGYIREGALNAIPGPPTSPFFFAALAWRLNDWVPQVRQAARRCAERVLADVEAPVAAASALHLFDRSLAWGRWGDEQQALHDVFGRADVVALLAQSICERATGNLAFYLRQASRYPAIDEHLGRLMTDAVQPAVRVAALQTLISGKALWPQGSTWAWVDKVYGLRRRIAIHGSREIRRTVQPEQLIAAGIRDRSPKVRWAAAGALMAVQQYLPEAAALIADLANDKSPKVRARAEFMQRRVGH